MELRTLHPKRMGPKQYTTLINNMPTIILIYLAITQIGGIGMNVHEKTFPTLELCNHYAESEFLSNKEHWIHKSKTYNFYNSQYEMNIKDSVNGDMRVYYSCVKIKKQES